MRAPTTAPSASCSLSSILCTAAESAHQFLQSMIGNPDLSAYESVRNTWKQQLSGKGDFEANWRKALHDGWIPDTAFQAKSRAP